MIDYYWTKMSSTPVKKITSSRKFYQHLEDMALCATQVVIALASEQCILAHKEKTGEETEPFYFTDEIGRTLHWKVLEIISPLHYRWILTIKGEDDVILYADCEYPTAVSRLPKTTFTMRTLNGVRCYSPEENSSRSQSAVSDMIDSVRAVVAPGLLTSVERTGSFGTPQLGASTTDLRLSSLAGTPQKTTSEARDDELVLPVQFQLPPYDARSLSTQTSTESQRPIEFLPDVARNQVVPPNSPALTHL